jgi:hypothetical protein
LTHRIKSPQITQIDADNIPKGAGLYLRYLRHLRARLLTAYGRRDAPSPAGGRLAGPHPTFLSGLGHISLLPAGWVGERIAHLAS